jgi:hypothetical protein
MLSRCHNQKFKSDIFVDNWTRKISGFTVISYFTYHLLFSNSFLSSLKKRVETQNKGRAPAMTGLRRFSVVVEGVKHNIREQRKGSTKQTLPDVAHKAVELVKDPSDVMVLKRNCFQVHFMLRLLDELYMSCGKYVVQSVGLNL